MDLTMKIYDCQAALRSLAIFIYIGRNDRDFLRGISQAASAVAKKNGGSCIVH